MSSDDPRLESPPSLRIWLWAAIGLAIAAVAVVLLLMTNSARGGAAEEADLTVYKSPTCGCCAAWIGHLEAKRYAILAFDDDGGTRSFATRQGQSQ